MMNKSQRLQLKVLIKTRINQVKQVLNHSDLESSNESDFRQEIENLQNNLEKLENDSIGTCEQCGCLINYTYLIARPDSKCCERCEKYT